MDAAYLHSSPSRDNQGIGGVREEQWREYAHYDDGHAIGRGLFGQRGRRSFGVEPQTPVLGYRTAPHIPQRFTSFVGIPNAATRFPGYTGPQPRCSLLYGPNAPRETCENRSYQESMSSSGTGHGTLHGPQQQQQHQQQQEDAGFSWTSFSHPSFFNDFFGEGELSMEEISHKAHELLRKIDETAETEQKQLKKYSRTKEEEIELLATELAERARIAILEYKQKQIENSILAMEKQCHQTKLQAENEKVLIDQQVAQAIAMVENRIVAAENRERLAQMMRGLKLKHPDIMTYGRPNGSQSGHGVSHPNPTTPKFGGDFFNTSYSSSVPPGWSPQLFACTPPPQVLPKPSGVYGPQFPSAPCTPYVAPRGLPNINPGVNDEGLECGKREREKQQYGIRGYGNIAFTGAGTHPYGPVGTAQGQHMEPKGLILGHYG